MKKRITGILLGLVMLYTPGCASHESNASNQQSQEVPGINIAITSEGKADLLDATSYDSAMALYGAVYEPLVEYGEKGIFKPGLAESWEILEGGKKYVFHLKKGMKFSDGSDVTAEAVRFTIERAKYKNPSTTLQTLMNLEKIEAVDELTVEMYFSEVSNQVLAELCQTRPLRVMSPHSVAGQDITGEFKQAIGSGPFIVKDSTAEHTVLEPNPYFNQGNPVSYQVTFQMIEDGSSRTLALKSGEIDIVGGTLSNITDMDIDVLKSDQSYQVHEFPGTMSHFLAFNPDNKLLNSPVRKAIELAINKAALSNKKLTGLFQPNVQYVTDGNQEASVYDVNKARRLLESEGYTENKDGYYENENGGLVFDLVIQTAEFPEWKEKAELIESDLKKAGVKINISIQDRESYYDVLWNTKKYDLIFYRTYTDALLPYSFLNSLYHNTNEAHGVLTNDSKLTQLLDDFGQTADAGQQQTIFDAIFKRISEEALAIPIEYKNEQFVTSRKIAQFQYSGLSDAPIDFKALMVE
ncbi:nickel ABC transporter substrate-binding protein [Paenibacillus sp. 79R4]|uniref:ABC transporter substrate-binding protein n=1 Tax=Paenibacillus sp. 79R4 TaxID=2212847 RepID=UPI0015C03885|nr:ABC transporter substrate-binding protein [Paenibacillus sp. 79R4]NWL87927.1 nickel ABC transporter substrate-binding protein [Paenibacillus sp. 79R4]